MPPLPSPAIAAGFAAALRRRSHPAVRRLAALALMALGCSQSAPAAVTRDCRIPGIRNSVQCGSVTRPLDPLQLEGPSLTVRYVVVPAMARRKLADPVFLIAGGPGQSAIDVAPGVMALFARLNNRRDIVFVDQRGTGRSASLACPDLKHAPLAVQADPEQQFERLMACKATLARMPGLRGEDDLRFFTTSIAMQDLDAVRRQLGVEQIDLVGVSYGTRAVLDYLRQYPGAVRRAVLDAVAPPDMALPRSYSTDGQAALDALFMSCEASAACAERYPSLRRDWRSLLAGLPRPVVAAHPLTGAIEHFQLTRSLLLSAVRQPLYVPSMAAALPAAISAAAAGRFEPLLGASAMPSSGRPAPLAMGLHFSVVCAEDLTVMDQSADKPGADFGNDDADFYRRVCARWPRGAVAPDFYRVPPSRTPTLLLSGGLDPATPPRHATAVARALGATARQIVVPNAGHGLLGIGCMRDVVYRFIDADSDADALAVDAGCIAAVPRPPAFLPITLSAEVGR